MARSSLYVPTFLLCLLSTGCGASSSPTTGSSETKTRSLVTALQLGDGEACASTAVTETVIALVKATFTPYNWSDEEKAWYVEGLGLSVTEITVSAKDPALPSMTCEATLIASSRGLEQSLRTSYQMTKMVEGESDEVRVALADTRVTSRLLDDVSRNYVTDVLNPARRVAADNAAAPICNVFREHRGEWTFEEVYEKWGRVSSTDRDNRVIGHGPLARDCLREMDEELARLRSEVQTEQTATALAATEDARPQRQERIEVTGPPPINSQ